MPWMLATLLAHRFHGLNLSGGQIYIDVRVWMADEAWCAYTTPFIGQGISYLSHINRQTAVEDGAT